MHLLLTILVFFLIFSLLIVIHELGHFMMARRHGVKVEEFGFGLPPKLWSKKVGETEYSINAIPFGGFVRLLGEDSHDKKAKTSPKSFSRKTLFQRFQIVFAGVAMNFLLAWLLLSIGFTVGMQPLLVNGDDFLQAVREGRVNCLRCLFVPRPIRADFCPRIRFLQWKVNHSLPGMIFRPYGRAFPISHCNWRF